MRASSPRIAITALLALFAAPAADLSDFSGIWSVVQPAGGPPFRLQLTQSGSKVQVRLSGRDTFPDAVFGVATIENGVATWTAPQGCEQRFQWPGYNYDNPGTNTFTLSLRQPGPSLVYVQETRWNVPCANNHPIGTERVERILKRE
jgi:hypothetical protein